MALTVHRAGCITLMDHPSEEFGLHEGRETQIGDRVRFAASDVFLPEIGAGSPISTGVTELEGTVIEFSDSGAKKRAYAVVEVVTRQMMVVPVRKLQSVANPPQGEATN